MLRDLHRSAAVDFCKLSARISNHGKISNLIEETGGDFSQLLIYALTQEGFKGLKKSKQLLHRCVLMKVRYHTVVLDR